MKLSAKTIFTLMVCLGTTLTGMAQALTNNGGVTITVLSGTTMVVGGDLLIKSSGVVDNSGGLTVTGNWTNNGTASVGTGTVELKGTSLQTVNGTTPTEFGNLTVNNAADVTLTKDIVVNSALLFSAGKINTGSNKVTLNVNGTVSGAGTGKYVNGRFEKFLNTTFPKVFEIGDAVNYTPVDMTFTGSITGGGSITASSTGSDHPQIASSTVNPLKDVNRYWTLTNSGLSGFTYSATFHFINAVPVDLDAGANTGTFRVSYYKSSTWFLPTLGTLTTSSSQATGLGVTDFGDFAIGQKAPYVWQADGTNGDDWFEPLNWLPNIVPNSCGDNATIPNTGTPPHISNIGGASVGDVDIADGVRLNLDANSPLNVCGTWTGGTTNPALVLDGTGAVNLTGITSQTLSKKTQFNTLHLNNTAGIDMDASSEVDIFVALELENGNFDASLGKLTFRSPVDASASKCAIINDFNYGWANAPTNTIRPGSLTGQVYAERFYRDASVNGYSFDQHFMGSPLAVTDISDPAGFAGSGNAGWLEGAIPNCYLDELNPGSPYGTFMLFNEQHATVAGYTCISNCWKALTGGATIAGNGYAVAKIGAGTLKLHGTANLANSYAKTGLTNSGWTCTATYKYTTAPSGFNPNMVSGWHLLSNPYLSTLNLTDRNNTTDFDAQVQVWQGGGVFGGSYQAMFMQNGLHPSPALIAPFGAFMVHKTNVGGFGTFRMDGSDRTTAPTSFYRQANDQTLTVYAENVNTGLLDITSVGFNVDATTNQFDPMYDANKLGGVANRHTLYTINPNADQLAVNTNYSVEQTPTVPMAMRPGVDGNYRFNFDGINSFDPTTYVYLEDKLIGSQWVNLRNSQDYNFNMVVTESPERFVLHFTPPAQFNSTNASCDILGMINIVQPGIADWSYFIVDASSNIVGSGTLNQNNPISVAAAAGIYTVTLRDNNGYTVVKNIQVNGSVAADASFTASTTTVPATDDVTFHASNPGTQITWEFSDGGIITGVANPTYSFQNPGTYTVTLTVTNSDGCSTSTTQNITVTAATGIGNVANSNGITIWSSLNKVIVDFSKMKNVEATIDIYNILGQQLSTDKMSMAATYTKEINNLEAAYVMVKVKTADGTITKKVFITNSAK